MQNGMYKIEHNPPQPMKIGITKCTTLMETVHELTIHPIIQNCSNITYKNKGDYSWISTMHITTVQLMENVQVFMQHTSQMEIVIAYHSTCNGECTRINTSQWRLQYRNTVHKLTIAHKNYTYVSHSEDCKVHKMEKNTKYIKMEKNKMEKIAKYIKWRRLQSI